MRHERCANNIGMTKTKPIVVVVVGQLSTRVLTKYNNTIHYAYSGSDTDEWFAVITWLSMSVTDVFVETSFSLLFTIYSVVLPPR